MVLCSAVLHCVVLCVCVRAVGMRACVRRACVCKCVFQGSTSVDETVRRLQKFWDEIGHQLQENPSRWAWKGELKAPTPIATLVKAVYFGCKIT